MLRDILFIARKDLRYMLRARETLLWIFVMPIVFFFFIGTITGGSSSSVGGPAQLAIWEGEDAGFLAEQLARRLEEQDFAIVRPDSLHKFQAQRRRLTVPASFSDSVLAGAQVELLYGHDSEGLSRSYDRLRTARAAYTLLADLVVSGEQGEDPTPEAFARLNATPRALSIAVESAGKRKRIPSGFEQSVPGIMVMFTLLVLTTSGAVLLVIERRQGLLRRLAYAPIARTSIVLGKWGGKLVLGFVQIGFAMLAGKLLFKMDWGPSLGAVLLVMLAYGGLMASLGMLLGNLARTEGQASAIGVLAANILGALGGCWWPIEVTPDWMQRLALFLPTGWAMDALHKLVSFQASPADVIPHVAGMGLGAVLLLALTARIFRFE